MLPQIVAGIFVLIGSDSMMNPQPQNPYYGREMDELHEKLKASQERLRENTKRVIEKLRAKGWHEEADALQQSLDSLKKIK